jgi:hypothetical protein
MRFCEFSSTDKIKATAVSKAHSRIADQQSNEAAVAQPQSATDAQSATLVRQQQQLKLRMKRLQMDKLRKRERDLAASITAAAQPT